jgi:dihydroorotate dehydrogenase subfamily 2
MYTRVLKPLLFQLKPETAHELAVCAGRIAGHSVLTRALVRTLYGRSTASERMVDGVRYTSPVILAAGFDYNGVLTRILPQVGFGGVEVGSVTARPCSGNPGRQLWRLPSSNAIVVNKGLKNDGVDAVIKRLKHTPREPHFTIGVSIAKTNDEHSVDTEAAIADYCYSFRRLTEEDVGDYYTINISCPNFAGADAFTDPALCKRLLARLDEIPCSKPVYIKMPISTSGEQFDRLMDVAAAHQVSGLIIGNLNKHYDEIRNEHDRPSEYIGGISGAPCAHRANSYLKHAHERYGDRFTLIGCGGVFQAADAQAKFDAGADLVQLVTGMIYQGPALIGHINRAAAPHTREQTEKAAR